MLDHDRSVTRWTCPACERQFGRAHQAHVCVPAGTIDESFAGRPPVQREILDDLLTHLRALGPGQIDAVRVGVFLYSDRKLAEIRPLARSLALIVVPPRPTDHPRIARRMTIGAGRIAHVVKLVTPEDIDDDVRAWLTEAYAAATDQ